MLTILSYLKPTLFVNSDGCRPSPSYVPMMSPRRRNSLPRQENVLTTGPLLVQPSQLLALAAALRMRSDHAAYPRYSGDSRDLLLQ